MPKEYRLKIWQKREVPKPLDYLKKVIIVDAECITITNDPHPKSSAPLTDKGMKWVDGTIWVKNVDPCQRALTTRITNNEYFKIWIKAINKRN